MAFSSRRAIRAAVVAACAISASCDEVVGPKDDDDPTTTCLANGTPLQGDLAGDTLTAAGGPYVIRDSAMVRGGAWLRVQEGVTICLHPPASIMLDGRLEAFGTAEAPITIERERPDPSYLIRPVGSGFVAEVRLRHVRILGGGIFARGGSLSTEDVTIEEAPGGGIATDRGRLVRTVLSSTCDEACASEGARGALRYSRFSGQSGLTLEDVTIRDAQGDGLSVGALPTDAPPLSVDGLVLEDVSGHGVTFEHYAPDRLLRLTRAGSIRFRNVGGDLIRGPARAAALLATPGFEGPVGEPATVSLVGAVQGKPLELGPGPLWRLLDVTGVDTLVLRPGAEVEGPTGDSTAIRVLRAKGTEADPVRLSGSGHTFKVSEIWGNEGLSHVHVAGATVRIDADQAHVASSTFLGAGPLVLSGDFPTVAGVVFEGATSTTLRLDGLGARVQGCSVSNSSGDGVVVRGAHASIHQCNLVDNAGAGVASEARGFLDARRDWWGAAGGAGAVGADEARGGELDRLHGGLPVSCADLWGRSATDLFFLCGNRLYRWSGETAEEIGASRPGGLEHGVWAGPERVWWVGSEGSICRWDGSAVEALGGAPPVTLLDVHGTSNDDVYIVGRGDALLHWDGRFLRPLWTPGDGDITHVWVVEGHLYLLRESGEILVGSPLDRGP